MKQKFLIAIYIKTKQNKMARRVFRRKLKKRSFRKKFSKKSRSGMGSHGKRFFKLRIVGTVASDSSGVWSQVFNDNPAGFTDWTAITQLFDEYKICAMKVKYIPTFPPGTSTTGAGRAFSPVYIGSDDNSVAGFASGSGALASEDTRVKNVYTPFSYYHKFPKLSSDGTSSVTLINGWRSIASTGGLRCIRIYSDGLSLSSVYGQYVLTAYIVARHRK